ncbi:MAG TPA: YceI family protein, partial [Gammaproteobacteria bacterium]
YIAHGTLDMKGVRRPFDLPFALKKIPDGYRATGKTGLERLEFGVGTGEWSDTQWLGNTVNVTFSIEAT